MNPHNWPFRMAEDNVLAMADPGDAGRIKPTGYGQVCALVSAAAETRTLADPIFVGQRFTLAMVEDGGDVTVTADSPVNQTGNNTLVFGDVKDAVDFFAVPDGDGGFEWRVAANDTVALSTV